MFTRLNLELTMGFYKACGAVWAQMLGLGHPRPMNPLTPPEKPVSQMTEGEWTGHCIRKNASEAERNQPVPPYLRVVSSNKG